MRPSRVTQKPAAASGGSGWIRKLSFGALSLGLATACSAAFTSPSELQSLRVLGVQVNTPYAKPGSKVSFDLLYWDGSKRAYLPDGSPNPDHKVQILWLGGCHDPDGDLYYGCYPQLAARLSKFDPNAKTPPPELLEIVGLGPRFTETIPEDIITRKPANSGDTVPYGLSFVFFAVCGGKIGPAPSGSTSALPLGCYDPITNEPLGADDFVIGYTPVYSYDTLTNNNPVVTGGTFDGKPGMVKACKADTDCDPKERCGKLELCIPVVPHCTAKAVKDCQTYAIKPTLDQARTVELDSAAPPIDGKTPEEFIWVAFYTSDGSLEKGLSLVNDAQKGWNADYEGKWSAPNARAGESRIWTVIHDNRGGTSWWWQDVFVD